MNSLCTFRTICKFIICFTSFCQHSHISINIFSHQHPSRLHISALRNCRRKCTHNCYWHRLLWSTFSGQDFTIYWTIKYHSNTKRWQKEWFQVIFAFCIKYACSAHKVAQKHIGMLTYANWYINNASTCKNLTGSIYS
jgi:hypothetical protein